MKELFLEALEFMQREGVDYADIRLSELREEEIVTVNRGVQSITSTYSKGYGIRAYCDGSMGFASSQDLGQVFEVARLALEIARASRLVQVDNVGLGDRNGVVDTYRTPIVIDPFTVSTKEKLDLLFAAEHVMLETEPSLFMTKGVLIFQKETKTFMATDGPIIVQELYESGGGIEAIAGKKGEVQVRSYPCSRGNYATAGFEFVESLELVDHAPEIAREAVALLAADSCPSGVFDVILDSSQLILQIHESIGHAVELDRVFGHEAAFFGTSFLDIDMLGFKYGSEHVSVVADATVPHGMGTYGYDDDGEKAQRTPIITNGVFNNFLSSRDTSNRLGLPSNGTSRASSWGRTPLVRMTNINLLPGDQSLEELISGISYGFYFQGNKSWSIDDQRLNFQFGCEIAWEIVDGRLTGKALKNPVYSGVTPAFWASCDGVADAAHWQMMGTRVCGKAEPEQTIHVGHGSAPARFRQVKVGV